MDSRPRPDGDFSAFFESQAGPLGRLARSLVRDSAAAEDLVQETWTEFLRRPPARDGEAGGFLATLTRRLAGRARRGEERRRERERLAARPEGTGDPDEFAERAGVLREVLEVVTGLREPYRSTLWQRYFDDLPPREIARRSGESLASVKSRLQRGLELVRQELDRRHGGKRSQWVVALLPLKFAKAAPLGVGITGGMLMGSAMKLTAAAVVVACCTGWFLWSRREGPAPGAGELLAQAPPAAEDAASPAPAVPAPDTQARTAVVEPAEPVEPPLVVPDELSHPFLYVLVVRTLDPYGLPIESASLRVAPARSSLNVAAPLFQQAGLSTLIWRGKQAEMDVDIQFGSSGKLAGGKRVRVRAGTPCEVALIAPHARNSPGRVTFRMEASSSLRFVVGNEFMTGYDAGGLAMERFPHPHARFADRFVRVVVPPPVETPIRGEFTALFTERVLEEVALGHARQVQVRGTVNSSQFILGGSVLGESEETTEIHVLVLDEQGMPVSNALVAVGEVLDTPERTAFTDGEGKAMFSAVSGGWKELRAGGSYEGLARERRFVESPNDLHWTARLDRGARVIGRVVDSEGEGVDNVIVRYESLPDVVVRGTSVSMSMETRGGEEVSERGDASAPQPGELRAPWVDEAGVGEGGRFEFANLPAGVGRLVVLRMDNPDELPWIVEEGVLPGQHEYVLRLPATLATMRLAVTVPEEWESEALELRAISDSTGKGSTFAQHDGGYRCRWLASGWYRVELGAGCLGWHDLGRHYLEEGAELDLGTFVPPPPGRVHVVAPASAGGERRPLELTFYLRRDDLDVRGDPRTLSGSEDLNLPAGSYWAFWTHPDGTLAYQAFSLAAGETVTLDLR